MASGSWQNKDTLAGAVFVLFGALALVVARRYEAGTLLDMGPGYFPRVLGALLVLLGLWIAARGLRAGGPARAQASASAASAAAPVALSIAPLQMSSPVASAVQRPRWSQCAV